MAQGVVLMFVGIALVGHLTLGNRARWMAKRVMPTSGDDSTATASATTPAAAKPATATPSRPTATARPGGFGPDFGGA